MPTTTALAASDPRLNAVVSVTQMAAMVGLSRAQFHYHVRCGAFLPPVYCTATRRPLYPRKLQLRNLKVREDQVGIDGRYVLFYEQRQPNDATNPAHAPASGRRNNTRAARSPRVQHDGLIEGLRGLGLSNVTSDVAAAAVRLAFPDGTAGVGHSDLLRGVYRHIRRSGNA